MDRLNLCSIPPPSPLLILLHAHNDPFLIFFVPALHQLFLLPLFITPSTVISVDAFTVVALSLSSHRLLEERMIRFQTRFLWHVETLTPPPLFLLLKMVEENVFH
ncbi:hypothetical protein CEXT_709301 [Caerostris extrusa]|uniref:Uncharacterized protein n=1 Tax=Caerostris extrusa TaxID=172846 RepID=A0AAV4MRQ2_CAEEX|nr:hypothetical protein CEXT_709301 [Caerostris extrusa]